MCDVVYMYIGVIYICYMHIASYDIIIVCMCTCKSCHVCSVVLNSLRSSLILTVHVTDEPWIL